MIKKLRNQPYAPKVGAGSKMGAKRKEKKCFHDNSPFVSFKSHKYSISNISDDGFVLFLLLKPGSWTLSVV
jgi:hypothetical protein